MALNNELIQNLLDTISNSLGLPHQKVDNNGFCQLGSGDDSICLQVFEERNQLIVFSSVCELPATHQLEVLTSLMQMNLFWAETAGATLAYDGVENSIVVQYSENTQNLDAEVLERLLINFNKLSELVKKHIEEIIAQLTLGSDAALPSAEKAEKELNVLDNARLKPENENMPLASETEITSDENDLVKIFL